MYKDTKQRKDLYLKNEKHILKDREKKERVNYGNKKTIKKLNG